MTGITAAVVADSVSPAGVRLTTLQLRFPTCILAQLGRYGSLAMSARSLRAVRTETLIAEVEADPFVPAEWRRAQKGMVAGEVIPEAEAAFCRAAWLTAMHEAVHQARVLSGGHFVAKEHVNRLLAPFAHSVAAVTGTDDAWDHLLKQRLADDAQPEFRALAVAIRDALAGSTPRAVPADGWHVPYVGLDANGWGDPRVSAGRCARVSYGRANGRPAHEDHELAARLMRDGHWSPLEHPCLACSHKRPVGRHRGWLSLRARLGH